MLTPSKQSHPDQTVIFVAMKLVARLRAKRLISFDDLRALAIKSTRGGDVLFLPALNFLFLVGVIEYRAKTDAFEYVGQA